MAPRWWDVEFYEERARQPGCLTVICLGDAGFAIATQDPAINRQLLTQLAASTARRKA